MLEEILDLLRDIQNSPTGSIGSIRSHYIPQLRVGRVDELAAQLVEYLLTPAVRASICAFCGNILESDGQCLLCGKVTTAAENQP